MIYADNAATTKLDNDAFEAMKYFLTEDYGNASQPYSYARNAKRALREARATIAKCIGALPEEIYFTAGGTESNNWAIKSLPDKDEQFAVATSDIEHHAVLNACAAIERTGKSVKYLPVDREGVVAGTDLENALTNTVKLVSIMLVNNEIGTIEPVSKLAGIAHKHGALFHTDAVQAVGHIPVNVKKLGVDMLSASGHKFNAPKGVGFLYIKKGLEIYPYADGGAQESGLRAGTENIASIVAMAVALKNNCQQMAATEERLLDIEQSFLQTLNDAGLNYIRNGAYKHVPGNINVSFKNADGEMLLHRLDLKGICISTGSACDSKNTKVSHVIKAIDVPEEYAKGTVRISFGRYNTEQEAVKVATAIVAILRGAET